MSKENVILINHNKNWGLKLDDRSLMIDRWIKKTANEILKEKGFKKNVELSVYFVGRKKARDLNIKYRQKDYYPQVLGFPMSQKKDVDGKIRLGDIVICTQKLKYEVKFQKSSLERVLYEWLIHGVENLLK
jgi:rRNA maturation RNase YbeY